MGSQLAKSIFDGVIQRFEKSLALFGGHALNGKADGIPAD